LDNIIDTVKHIDKRTDYFNFKAFCFSRGTTIAEHQYFHIRKCSWI